MVRLQPIWFGLSSMRANMLTTGQVLRGQCMRHVAQWQDRPVKFARIFAIHATAYGPEAEMQKPIIVVSLSGAARTQR
jgi:hypothetical protein